MQDQTPATYTQREKERLSYIMQMDREREREVSQVMWVQGQGWCLYMCRERDWGSCFTLRATCEEVWQNQMCGYVLKIGRKSQCRNRETKRGTNLLTSNWASICPCVSNIVTKEQFDKFCLYFLTLVYLSNLVERKMYAKQKNVKNALRRCGDFSCI